ncbi:MAG: hypothetical protein IJ200_03195 [Prevotella sp.]|nr:hypothetical protein [Prevotella sp.]
MKYYYKVAEHTFSVAMPDDMAIVGEMGQYAPFSVPESADVLFELNVVPASEFPRTEHVTVEMNQDDDGSQILAGKADGLPYFEFQLWGRCAARMVTDEQYRRATAVLVDEPLFGINNALMVMFALATATHQTALFHSSVVSYRGRGYMFLGKSGTGKSTHSSLWLRHIEGTELVNDDNPVVRQLSDGIYVFGSPWSGKTPCYRNVRYPVGAIVQLSQAPYNAIRRLRPLEAYAALVPSISGKRWDKVVAEGLHETENLLAGHVAVWHLECLPDEAAAMTCKNAVAV